MMFTISPSASPATLADVRRCLSVSVDVHGSSPTFRVRRAPTATPGETPRNSVRKSVRNPGRRGGFRAVRADKRARVPPRHPILAGSGSPGWRGNCARITIRNRSSDAAPDSLARKRSVFLSSSLPARKCDRVRGMYQRRSAAQGVIHDRPDRPRHDHLWRLLDRDGHGRCCDARRNDHIRRFHRRQPPAHRTGGGAVRRSRRYVRLALPGPSGRCVHGRDRRHLDRRGTDRRHVSQLAFRRTPLADLHRAGGRCDPAVLSGGAVRGREQGDPAAVGRRHRRVLHRLRRQRTRRLRAAGGRNIRCGLRGGAHRIRRV